MSIEWLAEGKKVLVTIRQQLELRMSRLVATSCMLAPDVTSAHEEIVSRLLVVI